MYKAVLYLKKIFCLTSYHFTCTVIVVWFGGIMVRELD